MIKIEDIYINSSYYDIITAFKMYINSRGINLLKDIKLTSYNIMITCPFHNNGQEKKPSCGISMKDGIVHCFACGSVRTFTQLLSYCLGYNDNGEKGKQWIIDNIDIEEVEQREINLNIKRNQIIYNNYVSEEELDKYRYIHPYMYERKLTDAVINEYDVGFDKDTNTITFPVRDRKGNTLFVARRSIIRKFFNYPNGVEKPLYGIYEMKKDTKEIIICESIFNCLTCKVYGKEALALNGTGSKEQLDALEKLNVRVIYLGLDNDEAGNKGCIKIAKRLKNKFILKRMIFPVGKDINDLTKEEFDKIFYNSVKII